MKVLMLGWEFPPHNSGGLGVACLGLAEALVDQDVNVTFVLPHVQDNLSHDKIKLRFAGVTNLKIKSLDTALTPYVTSEEYELYRSTLPDKVYGGTLFEEMYRYAQLIKDIALEEDFDVIHAHDWLSYLAGVEAKRVSGKPLVLHVHATSFDQAGRGNVNPQQLAIEKYSMQAADRVIAISQFTKDTIVHDIGIDPEKVRVVHNGVYKLYDNVESQSLQDILSFKESGYKIVLYLGRLTIQKGPDYFLRAAHRTLQYEPKTIFVVAGSGDMEWQMIREAAAMGISDKIIFAGFVRGAERTCLYRSADLYIMPSVSEPFGLTPLEALLEGDTPALISKQSGVSEVLKNALKVDFWDTDEMANKIVSVLRNDPLRNQLTYLGKEEAAEVTWSKAAHKCIDIYRELMQGFQTALS